MSNEIDTEDRSDEALAKRAKANGWRSVGTVEKNLHTGRSRAARIRDLVKESEKLDSVVVPNSYDLGIDIGDLPFYVGSAIMSLKNYAENKDSPDASVELRKARDQLDLEILRLERKIDFSR